MPTRATAFIRTALPLLFVLDGCRSERSPEPDASVCTPEPSKKAAPSSWQPGKDANAPPASGPAVTLALRQIRFGEATWEGVLDTNAWQFYGHDLDGLVTTKCSSDHCRVPGWKAVPWVDGPGGLDNAFGQSLAMLLALVDYPSASAGAAIESGKATYLIRLEGAGSFQNASQVSGAFFVSGDRGAPPVWDGSDIWPIAEQPGAVLFPDGHIAENTWVSGAVTGGVIALDPRTDPPTPKIRIHNPAVALRLEGGSPARGVITGVIDPEELIAEFTMFPGGVCEDKLRTYTIDYIRRSVDIGLDLTNGDASVPCAGISVGIGFEAEPAQIGGTVPVELVVPSPCP